MVASARAAGAIGVFLALHASACAPAEPRIAWSIHFAEDVDPAAARASVVHASIRAGDCSSADAIYTAEMAFGESAPEPPSLPPGTWAFVAEAADPSCSVIASHCVAVTVPLASDTTVQLLLRADDPYPLCAATECRSGRCGREGDGGVDAGDVDAGPMEDATVAVDACTASSETECADGVDEDCDGATDCADSDCQGASCGASSSCCGGACVDTTTSNAHCGGCGSACDVGAHFRCTTGSCECESGWTECTAGTCTHTAVSEADCGTCGNACTPDLVCNSGTCGPAAATWTTRRFAADCPSRLGMTFQYDCEPNPTLSGSWSVYGTGTYYSVSDVCPSAVHNGSIPAAAGGVVTVRIVDGISSYPGSTNNGITSTTRGAGSCSFTFD